MGRCLQDTEGKRLQRRGRTKSDEIPRRRRRVYKVGNRQSASQVVLVGHSYGGVVITEAGTHPQVTDLVYIAAFAPDKGESVSSLIANPPPGAPVPPILPPQDGYLFLDRAKFATSFAADVEPGIAS